MTQTKSNSNIVAIITMCFIFAMISFVTNMGAPFGNIWGFKYDFAASWGNLMNFTAYLFMGIPSGLLLKKIGYKKTALAALVVGIIGLALQYFSSIYGNDIYVNTIGETQVALNLYIYLLGALVCGFCVCMLNTVVNPMLNMLGGGGNKGNQLIQAVTRWRTRRYRNRKHQYERCISSAVHRYGCIRHLLLHYLLRYHSRAQLR